MVFEPEQLWDMEFEIKADKTVSHKGIFKIQEVYSLLTAWAKEHGYHKSVTEVKEVTKKTSRTVIRSFHLQRRLNPTYISVIKISMEFSNLKDVVLDVDKRREKFNDGEATINIKGYFMSSMKYRLEGRWSVAFVRGIIDKFIYKVNRPTLPAKVASESNNLVAKFRGLFGSYKKRLKS